MMIEKRDKSLVAYDREKIVVAITKANEEERQAVTKQFPEADFSEVGSTILTESEIKAIVDRIENRIQLECKHKTCVSVEEIQDMIESLLPKFSIPVQKRFMRYRYKRETVRKTTKLEEEVVSIIGNSSEELKTENSNKNTTLASTQRDYLAGAISKDFSERFLLPSDVVDAHKEGLIHFHDIDYFIQHIHNCCLVNLEDMLQNGTVISGTLIEHPHSFSVACTIAAQIVAQVASFQYGGQTINLGHLVPFVEETRKKIKKQLQVELPGIPLSKDEEERIVETRVLEDIKRGIQTITYQIVTLMTTNGQAPFVSMYMDISEPSDYGTKRFQKDYELVIKEVLKQRIEGIKNECGAWITPAFPKLLYVLNEENTKEEAPFFELTKLAVKSTVLRMSPDFISAKQMKEQKGDVYACMGCRSFLTPDRFTDQGLGNLANAKNYKEGKHKYWGRFNQGVVTLNLVDVACSSRKDKDRFFKILEERLALCHKALRIRHERLLGTKSDIAPILWQHGALARLKKGETIDKLLYDGYSTLSLGFAGLYECSMYMTGYSHTNEHAKPFAKKVMEILNLACNKWKEEENIDYSVYGTPLESTTYKFARCLKKRFGSIPKVTDKDYITNSYHVHVTEQIDAFSKLAFESEFQRLSPGGAISYIEAESLKQNLDAALTLVQYMYDTIMYAEINSKSDYCQVCGYDGEIKIVKEQGRLIWECPNCKNRNQSKMNVARRTCGYIGNNFWNPGRTEEISDRVTHI